MPMGSSPHSAVYLTHMYADYYNRISFAFEREMVAAAGSEGVKVAADLFIEAGHACAFNTMGGNVGDFAEWDALVLPMLKTREDWLFGIVGCTNALGWGIWKVLDVTPDGGHLPHLQRLRGRWATVACMELPITVIPIWQPAERQA